LERRPAFLALRRGWVAAWNKAVAFGRNDLLSSFSLKVDERSSISLNCRADAQGAVEARRIKGEF
jgi:hypothetical protein